MMKNDKPSYKYYVLNDFKPIRVAFNEAGHPVSAEIPDDKNESGFKYDNTYLSKAFGAANPLGSDIVDEVDEPTFAVKVQDYRRTPKP